MVTEMADMVSHLPGRRACNPCIVSSPWRMNGWRIDGAAIGGFGKTQRPLFKAWRNYLSGTHAVGTEDQFSPAAEGLKISTALLHGRYAEISECGHFPSLEAPEETADILLHWLHDAKLI